MPKQSTTSTSTETLIASLVLRIQELEDERAIRELLSRYGYNADNSRHEEYVNLYTDDGALDMIVDGVKTRYEGRDALMKFISRPIEHRKKGEYSRIMHLQGNNTVIHVNGDTAVANMYTASLLKDHGSPNILAAGNDQWTLRKVEGKWLIKERRLRFVGQEGYIDNLEATPD
jgi:ketosteroid isomerase-like protein